MTRILIVDDDRDIRETTADLLRYAGHEVETVGDANQILAAVRRYRPEVVLQDCHMPGLDLSSVVPAIRGAAGIVALPVLLFTASIESQEFWHRLGASGLLKKPFDLADLEKAIEQVLATPRPD